MAYRRNEKNKIACINYGRKLGVGIAVYKQCRNDVRATHI